MNPKRKPKLGKTIIFLFLISKHNIDAVYHPRYLYLRDIRSRCSIEVKMYFSNLDELIKRSTKKITTPKPIASMSRIMRLQSAAI